MTHTNDTQPAKPAFIAIMTDFEEIQPYVHMEVRNAHIIGIGKSIIITPLEAIADQENIRFLHKPAPAQCRNPDDKQAKGSDKQCETAGEDAQLSDSDEECDSAKKERMFIIRILRWAFLIVVSLIVLSYLSTELVHTIEHLAQQYSECVNVVKDILTPRKGS